MATITAGDIERLVWNNNLVQKPEYFTESEWKERLTNIEGSQFDLTIDKLYAQSPSSSPHLGRYSRNTGALVEVDLISLTSINEEGWILYPETHYIGLTGETVNFPNNLRGILNGRSSDYVIGIYPGVTNISPGYSGKLKFGMYVGTRTKLGKGARVITMTIQPIVNYIDIVSAVRDEDVQPYGGIWGGSKVTTDNTERPS